MVVRRYGGRAGGRGGAAAFLSVIPAKAGISTLHFPTRRTHHDDRGQRGGERRPSPPPPCAPGARSRIGAPSRRDSRLRGNDEEEAGMTKREARERPLPDLERPPAFPSPYLNALLAILSP